MGATAYGCLEHYEITMDAFRLQFKDEGTKALGLPLHVQVGLAVNPDAIDALRAGFEEVLAEVRLTLEGEPRHRGGSNAASLASSGPSPGCRSTRP
jgi:hypothetical protein